MFRPHNSPDLLVYAWQTKGDKTLDVLHRVLPYLVGDARGHAERALILASEQHAA